MTIDIEKMKIFESIEAKDWNKVRQLLRDDPENVRRVFLDKKTALHHALRSRVDLKTLKLFIELSADVNAEDPYGDTPIFEAIKADAPLETIQYLIVCGAKLDQQGYNGMTVVQLAAQNSDEKILECLLKNGADPNAGNQNSWTSVHYGAKNTNKRILELLFQYGTKLPAESESSKPTEVAAMNSTPDVLQVLIANGADIEPNKRSKATLLHFAAGVNADVAMSRFLVETLKIDVNCRDIFGSTALMDAAHSNPNVEIVKFLLHHGTDPALANMTEQRAFDLANTEEKKQVLRQAMQKIGIDPDIKPERRPQPGVYKGRSRGLKLMKIELGNNAKDKTGVPFSKRAKFFEDCDSKLICSWQQRLREGSSAMDYSLVYPIPSEEELNALIDHLDGKTESSYMLTLHKTDLEYLVVYGGYEDHFSCWFMENARKDMVFNLINKDMLGKEKYVVDLLYDSVLDAKHVVDREEVRKVALHYAKTGQLLDEYEWV